MNRFSSLWIECHVFCWEVRWTRNLREPCLRRSLSLVTRCQLYDRFRAVFLYYISWIIRAWLILSVKTTFCFDANRGIVACSCAGHSHCLAHFSPGIPGVGYRHKPVLDSSFGRHPLRTAAANGKRIHYHRPVRSQLKPASLTCPMKPSGNRNHFG